MRSLGTSWTACVTYMRPFQDLRSGNCVLERDKAIGLSTDAEFERSKSVDTPRTRLAQYKQKFTTMQLKIYQKYSKTNNYNNLGTEIYHFCIIIVFFYFLVIELIQHSTICLINHRIRGSKSHTSSFFTYVCVN